MLVLSRKWGESFLIGDDIEVFILDVQNDRVKVGISAPENIKIMRKELKEIEKANLDSANSMGSAKFGSIKKQKLIKL